MDEALILALASMFLTLVSVVTGFILQMERRRIKKMEESNSELKRMLNRSLTAIGGYHKIEEHIAGELKISTKQYRTNIRKAANVDGGKLFTKSKREEYQDKIA